MAIIALVLLVRACLHPITKRAQVNMMKMGKLGPEIERLKKKYGDNKEEFSKAQMGLYKQMGFTPVLGCLPLFLQMPIFIALFMSLQTTFELRHSPFFYGFTWIKDLAQPDMLIQFSRPVDIWITKIDAFNLLPLLVAVVQFLSFKYTPRPPATTPEQEQQQKMMQWMTLLFPLMFYKMPAGLNLYYLTSTGLGILEGKITRDHIKKQEELEKLNGPVIVDAGPSKRKAKDLHKEEPEKKTGVFGLWAKLQEAADKAREEAEKRTKK
jgi:YidC/Oxa1 family membrane protein insertase